jgi:nucleoside 2-deoxyribosyltransferase
MDGWLEIEKSLHKINSNQVFVAMDFGPSLMPIRSIIKKAIVDSGLTPILIDEVEHINYIPIEIQNKIKNCGLMVADLTLNNCGAYLEAGYAMGLNIPIIWCCRDSDKALHFDISQINNILWKNEEDLYNRLLKRLIAVKGMSKGE